MFLNIEIKAKCSDPAPVREWLLENGADFRGVDRQTDTYFIVNNGRLKLREGNIENNLIYYERADQAGPKSSFFKLVKVPDPAALKESLGKAMGIKTVVEKEREIYFIDNVKFHIDTVKGLGHFVEIEARNEPETLTADDLLKQCRFYMEAFGIKDADLLERSYSDIMNE